MTRLRWLLAVVALALLVVLSVLWIERRSLAQGYADDLLAARHVPARYTIAELGFGRQRLTGVVLGDPARPDLTADWIETRTRLGFGGPQVTALSAGRVRLRGRIVDGRVSLGALDRLLPAPSGRPFALPDLALAVADGRMRLDTPVGPVGLKLSGSGGLQGGFAGTLAAVMPRWTAGACAGERTSAYGRIRLARGGAPSFVGPVRAATARCGATVLAGATVGLDANLSAALDRWHGSATLAVAHLDAGRLRGEQVGGQVGFAGDTRATTGRMRLTAARAITAAGEATGLTLAGAYRVADSTAFTGTIAGRIAAKASLQAQLASWRTLASGTPVGPLLAQATGALATASRTIDGRAQLTAAVAGARWTARIATLDLSAPTRAAFRFGGGTGLVAGPAGLRIDGSAHLRGGGLPTADVTLTQTGPGAPLGGVASVAPYRAGPALLALTPVRFRATPGGRTQFATVATLSGPLGDGRVERATLPLVGGWDGGRRLVLNPTCARAGFARLAVAGLVLNRTDVALCPAGRAVVTLDDGRLGGGARIAAPRLSGTLGGTPLTLAAAGSELRFGDGGLTVTGLAARLGRGEPYSRLDLATLTGRFTSGGIAGRYTGGAGRIGAVPLLLSEAAGDWRLAGGALALTGALTVADAAALPRFKPLPARGITLRLHDGLVQAAGTLFAPGKNIKLADVAIRHRLADASGGADLTVPTLAFDDKLQPSELTRLTLGVIADVKGSVTGSGRIDWGPRGVTSSGTFRTAGTDLAAAFGPVTGLTGEIRFTDLLALESAPGQIATVASINPGVPVLNGVVRYQTLPGPMIRVEDGRWPFAGGALVLEPTLLDYSRSIDKRMTFRVEGLDAAVFLQNFDYKNLTATGTFDGRLPMIFDESGGRIEQGMLKARTGGTLAYVGDVSQANLGFWGNLAFGALKSLKYRSLDLTLYGPLGGEIVTEARFGGIAQGEGAKSNFLIRRLAALPFVFNVKITAPFRSLLDSARSFYDPSVLIQRNLPSLIDQEKRAARPLIQPPASQPVPQEKPH